MLKSNGRVTGAAAFGIVVLVGTMAAQVNRGTTEWLTAGADAQRTFSIRADPKISAAAMSQPGFELQWTARLDNRARGMNGLGQGVSANGVTLFIPMSIVVGSSNNVYALDNDTGYVVWQRHFESTLPPATPQCPGGMNAGATRVVPLMPAPITAAAAGFGGGRGAPQPYRSVLGEPGEGAPVEVRGGGPGRAAQPAAGAAPAGRGPGGAAPPATAAVIPPTPAPGAAAAIPGGAPAGRAGGGFGAAAGPSIPGATQEQLGGGRGGLGRPSGVVYAVSSDGGLHVLGLPSGKDVQRPAAFVPPNARVSDTIAVNTTLYATTSGNCGGAPNAIWAVDLESEGKPVSSWKSNGPIVGRVAFSTGGTVFAAIGPAPTTGDGKSNAIVALDSRTLELKDWFTQPGAEFVTGPVVFKQDDTELVAAATKDGRIVVLNATMLGGADHGTPQASAPIGDGGGSIAADALATWQEMTIVPAAPAAPAGAATAGAPAAPQPTITYGQRWILAATTNGIAAAKLSGSGTTLTLERGWTTQNLAAPATPIVVNGVVFALATGRPSAPTGRGTAAVLHAYEAASGKELWTSGKAMTAFASPGSFWSALSQVYVGTSDGTLQAFGFLDERRTP